MKNKLEILFASLCCVAVVGVAINDARAQSFPARPVKIVVPFAAGGPADSIGRILATKLGMMWNQPVVVENKVGGGGNIASDITAKAAPDGYTLLLAANSHVTNGSLYTSLSYDPIKDFTAVAGVAYYSLILVVNPGLPLNNLRDVVAYAKANPAKLSFGSAGTGTPTHLAAELFKKAAAINVAHVPYKGAAPATTDLLGGHLQAMFNNPVSALPFVESGKLRAIATTGLKRSPNVPNVPTVSESGYEGFEVGTWYAVLGPAGMDRNIVSKISSDVATILKMSDVIKKMNSEGIEIRSNSPEELSLIMLSEQKKWSKLIKDENIKID